MRVVDRDEHPRPETTLEALETLKPIVRPGGTVTAGNASGINDGACALLLASDDVVTSKKLKPLAQVLTWAVAGVEPCMMGMGPVPAAQKALKLAGLKIGKMDLIELNEAFAAQAIACLVQLGIDPGAAHVNPNGGAIALGHPLGMSGARLVATAARELKRSKGR
jgi:acetyl-CoA acetyltransferase family protein